MKTVHISTHELARRILDDPHRGICASASDLVSECAGVSRDSVCLLAQSPLVAALLRESFLLDPHELQQCLSSVTRGCLDPAGFTLAATRSARFARRSDTRRSFAQRLLQRPDRLVVALVQLNHDD